MSRQRFLSGSKHLLHLFIALLIITIIGFSACESPTSSANFISDTSSNEIDSTNDSVKESFGPNDLKVLYVDGAVFTTYFKPSKKANYPRAIFQFVQMKNPNSYELVGYKNKEDTLLFDSLNIIHPLPLNERKEKLEIKSINVIFGNQKLARQTVKEIIGELKQNDIVAFFPKSEKNDSVSALLGKKVFDIFYEVIVLENTIAPKPPVPARRTNPSPPASARLNDPK